jgi:hypothetical protein
VVDFKMYWNKTTFVLMILAIIVIVIVLERIKTQTTNPTGPTTVRSPSQPLVTVLENKPHTLLYNGYPVTLKDGREYNATTREYFNLDEIVSISIIPEPNDIYLLPYHIIVNMPYTRLTVHNRWDEDNPNFRILDSNKSILPGKRLKLTNTKIYNFSS